MNITRVGVDIAKSVFHVHSVDRHDQVQWCGKYSRAKWLDAHESRRSVRSRHPPASVARPRAAGQCR